jgi:hypothetical protein
MTHHDDRTGQPPMSDGEARAEHGEREAHGEHGEHGEHGDDEDREFLVRRFESYRPGCAPSPNRMLGSLAEADDAVQEAWLKLSRVDADGVRDLGGWLTTVVGPGLPRHAADASVPGRGAVVRAVRRGRPGWRGGGLGAGGGFSGGGGFGGASAVAAASAEVAGGGCRSP